ncbi:hypothetical protein [Streptomyces sp. enrichment culture]|uniref:hypothetical protein n=1 Tax=Streptomyces sp. enrichment culture TaxID=1795815 RepID=UPI003F5456C3
MGKTLYEATTPLRADLVPDDLWERVAHIDAAREAYDARAETSPTGSVQPEHLLIISE